MVRERRMVRRQHGMDGMSELVRQGRHVTGAAGVVHQYERRILRVDRSTERAPIFPLAHFTVQMILVEHAARQFPDLRVEGAE